MKGGKKIAIYRMSRANISGKQVCITHKINYTPHCDGLHTPQNTQPSPPVGEENCNTNKYCTCTILQLQPAPSGR